MSVQVTSNRSRVDYKIILWLPPIESQEDNGHDVAGCKDINHQRMHPHPLHYHSRAPISTHINLRIENPVIIN